MEQLTKKTIGQQINAALASKDVKQKELAKHLGVPDNTISYFVSGRRVPNTEQIIKIAQFLNVSTDFLLGLTPTQSTDYNIKNICEYTGLSEETIEKLHFLVKRTKEKNDDIYNLFEEDFIKESKEVAKKMLIDINSFLCCDSFYDTLEHITKYRECIYSRSESMDKIISNTQNLSPEEVFNSFSSVDSCVDTIKLSYYDATESIKEALFDVCRTYTEKNNKIDDMYKYLFSHKAIIDANPILKNAFKDELEEDITIDENSKKILEPVRNKLIERWYNQFGFILNDIVGDSNADNNQTE